MAVTLGGSAQIRTWGCVSSVWAPQLSTIRTTGSLVLDCTPATNTDVNHFWYTTESIHADFWLKYGKGQLARGGLKHSGTAADPMIAIGSL